MNRALESSAVFRESGRSEAAGSPAVSDARAVGDAPARSSRAEIGEELRRRVLDFEAPQMIEKLVATGVAESVDRAHLLWGELRKHLLLCRHADAPLPMNSAWVDAAWHQFVLFTKDYEQFCRERLGKFVHHVPTLASSEPTAGGISWSEYERLYESAFGPLPDVWRDWSCLREETRLRRAPGSDVLSVNQEQSAAVLLRGRGTPEVVCRVSPRAEPALEFIAAHRCLLIRELPGLRNAEDRLALARSLVRYAILSVAL